MTLLELTLSIALGMVISFLGMSIANNQAQLTKTLASYQSFTNTEASVREALSRTVGTANTATIYDTAENARQGFYSQTGACSSGNAIFLTFYGGPGAGKSSSAWATIELRQNQLVYHNSTGKEWILVDSITDPNIPFTSTNGVYMTRISVNKNPITIYTNLQ